MVGQSVGTLSGGGAVQERAEAAPRALLEDESKFIDFEHSSIFLTEEHEIFDYTKEFNWPQDR